MNTNARFISDWNREQRIRWNAEFSNSNQPAACVLRSTLYACDVQRLDTALGSIDLKRNPVLAVALLNRDPKAIGELLLQAIDHQIADDAQQDVEDEFEDRKEQVA